MTRSLLYCLCPTGNCFWYCVSTFITCMWRELYVLLFIAYYWWFYNKAFFFVVLLSYFDHLLGWMMKALSPVSMITGCMCAIRRKGTVASLTQPAPQQDSRALLLVVDDCAGDQGQPGSSVTVTAHGKDETTSRPCLQADHMRPLSKLQWLNISIPWLIGVTPAFQENFILLEQSGFTMLW